MPNSPNWHHKNCLAGSKEYLWWDLGSQRIDSGPIHLFSIILREFLGIMYSSREYPNPCESNCKFQRVWEVKDTGKYWGSCMFPLYFSLCFSFFLYPSFGLCTSEVLGISCFIKLWKNDITLVGYWFVWVKIIYGEVNLKFLASKEIISFHTSLKGVLVQLCCLPMKDNIETETPWLKFSEKVISQRKCISWTKSEKLIGRSKE